MIDKNEMDGAKAPSIYLELDYFTFIDFMKPKIVCRVNNGILFIR
jgi:hypothetical protein